MKIGSLLLFNNEMIFVVVGGGYPVWKVYCCDMPGAYHIDITEKWYKDHFILLLE